MVVALSPTPNSHSYKPAKQAPPVMRYTREDTLTAVLGVRCKFSARRRLVRLEQGVISVFHNGDDCGDPLFTVRLCELADLNVNPCKPAIVMRTSNKASITLIFKHDIALLQLWAKAMRRAYDNNLDTHYKVCGLIGSGHYAQVYEAFDRHTGDKVAVKVMPKQHADPKVANYTKREVEIVRLVNHPNIVTTLDVFETSTHLYIIMEHVAHGNLLQFLAGGKNRVNEKNALRIAKQLFHAIAYLHDNDIVHRDIKAENILITESGTIKLADFGLARRLYGVSSDEYCLSSILGTPAYCSPEVISRSPYGKPVDIFGCGVLLYIALSGALPFRGKNPQQVFASILEGHVSFPHARWGMVSNEARALVAKLLSVRPTERPTAIEALRHPWLQLSGDRSSDDDRPLSPRPFVRNASARSSARKPNSGHFHRVTSTSSFRRAQSGSLHQLTLDKMRQRLGNAA